MIKLKTIAKHILKEWGTEEPDLEQEFAEQLTDMIEEEEQFSVLRGYTIDVNYTTKSCHEDCPLGFDIEVDNVAKTVTLDIYDSDIDDDSETAPNGSTWWMGVRDDLEDELRFKKML